MIEIIATPSGFSRIYSEDEGDALSSWPVKEDGRSFYWKWLGPSHHDLLRLREETGALLVMELALSPQYIDVSSQLETAQYNWGFWDGPVDFCEYSFGDRVTDELPTTSFRPERRKAQVKLARRILEELVEDGVDLDADVDYDPSLTPSQVRHIRGEVASGKKVRALAEEDADPSPSDPLGPIKSRLGVSETELQDALEGKGPYSEIEGQHTMYA